LLYKVAKRGTPVLFFSLEMSSLSIAMRLLEMTSGLSSDEINSFDFLEKSTKEHILVNTKSASEAAEGAKLQRGMDELAALPFYINEKPGSRMMDISVNCQKIKNSIPKLGLIAIDYLGLITSQARKGGQDSRQQEVADISRQIKQLARTLEVPIIALSQLSRDTEKRQDHAPQLSDLRDSGAIEQDADMIFMLYREDYYSKGNEKEDEASAVTESNNPISQVRISLLKNRNGAIGYIDFIFDKEHCTFNVATQAHDDEAGI
ncbi:MAG: DnaB-like helicase C-terminal domain-containing protein, partial [Bacilli bacterium]